MRVKVWRNAAEAVNYPAANLSGRGAEIAGGRWNVIGVPLVYCSSNIALTFVETIAGIRSSPFPYNRFLVEISIPDDVWQDATNGFTSPIGGWDAVPAGFSSKQFGTDWANSLSSALLIVPSVHVPEEANVLINPRHPDASRITACVLRRWIYDPRMFA